MIPLISVITPVYNSGMYLPRCLNSIATQSYKNYELYLTDDGSVDDSGSICDEYALEDDRVTIIHQPNSGVSRARNMGIELANGDYYHFPDSDDYIEPAIYEICLKLIDEHNCDAVVFEHFTTYADHEDRHRSQQEYYGLYEGKDEIIKISFRTAFTWNKFFKKKLIPGSDTSPGIKFREDIYRGEDSIFSRDALYRAERVWFTDMPFYHYVQSEESACRGVFRPSQLSLLDMIEDNKAFYSSYFPEYLPAIIAGELESLIMLYGDMELDLKDYSTEQAKLYNKFINTYKTEKNRLQLNAKQKCKFLIFKYCPQIFILMHKFNVQIRRR